MKLVAAIALSFLVAPAHAAGAGEAPSAAPQAAQAAPSSAVLPYSGRLLDEQGKAISGTVDLQLDLYGSESGDDILSTSALTFAKVPLENGIFRLSLAMTAPELQLIFGDGQRAVFLQVKDLTHGRVYRRQRFNPPEVVAALQPPPAGAASIAGSTPATAQNDKPSPPVPPAASAPRDQLAAAAGAACLGSPVAGAKFVTLSRNRSASCAAACSEARAGAGCVRGWTVYAEGAYFDFGNECSSAVAPPGPVVEARFCCCLVTGTPLPLMLGVPPAQITH